jgi:hypothetical protein
VVIPAEVNSKKAAAAAHTRKIKDYYSVAFDSFAYMAKKS